MVAMDRIKNISLKFLNSEPSQWGVSAAPIPIPSASLIADIRIPYTGTTI